MVREISLTILKGSINGVGCTGGRGPWGKSGQNQPDLEKLIRQAQAQLKSILPGGSPRGLVAVGVHAASQG
jgi:hypothetical protein